MAQLNSSLSGDLGLPFFSAKDSEILNGESTRDPLGLLPIWSTVGHALIPGLASIVSSIDGIQGILFIYTCLHSFRRIDKSKQSDGELLGFFERFWEYHLYKSKRVPCFGINSLGVNAFSLTNFGNSIVGTGLRQYYRGTCVNKRIIDAHDLKTLKDPFRGIANSTLNAKVAKRLCEILPEAAETKFEIAASQVYDPLSVYLEEFSMGNKELWVELEEHLINDAGKGQWIEYLFSQHQRFENTPTPHLVQSIQAFARQKHDDVLDLRCQRILDCEPFIQLLQAVFLIAQEESRNTVPNLAKQIETTAPDDLAKVCENFQRIDFPSGRLSKLQKLAELLRGKDFEGFLRGFLRDYYKSVCQERGKNPIVLVDEMDVIALTPGKTGNSWHDSTGPQNWKNDYFLHAQLSLYRDLMARRSTIYG